MEVYPATTVFYILSSLDYFPIKRYLKIDQLISSAYLHVSPLLKGGGNGSVVKDGVLDLLCICLSVDFHHHHHHHLSCISI